MRTFIENLRGKASSQLIVPTRRMHNLNKSVDFTLLSDTYPRQFNMAEEKDIESARNSFVDFKEMRSELPLIELVGR